MTISSITFDHALPLRQPVDLTQGRGWSSITDEGTVELDNGKVYHFLCSRTCFRQAPKGERVVWEVELRSVQGVRIHSDKLVELRKELQARFKARIEQANRDIDQEQAASDEAAQVEPAAPLAHVVTFHHAANPDRIGREIVEGAGDRDQAVAIFLSRTLSEVVILACEVLDTGADHPAVEEGLSWVEVPADRRAHYIKDAYSQVPFFAQGFLSITRRVTNWEVTQLPGDFDSLEDAKAAAQAFHEATPIAQVIDLRPGAYGYREYLTEGSVWALAEGYGIKPAEVIAQLLAGDTFIQTATYLRKDAVLVKEDIKAWRILRAPIAPNASN